MQVANKYIPFILSSAGICIILFFIYPHYQYYVDPDATAYLSISKYYAAGDFKRAINGYWSPLGCWFSALFIRAGFDAMLSAVAVNTMAGIGVVFITNSFFVHFDIDAKLKWLLNGAFLVFIPYAVFSQLYNDLWQAFLLLSVLRIMMTHGFDKKPVLWLSAGLLGGLAFYAKSYAVPYTILNMTVCSFVILEGWKRSEIAQWLKICAVVTITMIACMLPWMYLLHAKYGIWVNSTAVKLNASWSLIGHPYFKDSIHGLLPPAYSNSVSFWEDPYFVNGKAPQFYHSFALFRMQIVRSVYHVLVLIKCMTELSFLFMAVWLFSFILIVSKKVRDYFPKQLSIVSISFMLFPVGLIFIKSDPRYIWYMLPISMLVGAVALKPLVEVFNNKKSWLFVSLVFSLSYICYPVLELGKMYDEGKNEYMVSKLLKEAHLTGSFTSNADFGLASQRVERLGYFSGMPYYYMPFKDISARDLLQEMRRYHVAYYFYCAPPQDISNFNFYDESGKALAELTNNKIPGLKIFRLN